jgi:hypothetical protein
MNLRKAVGSKSAFVAVVSAGLFFGVTGTASAYIVCNDDGDCWHVHHKIHHSGVHMTFYDDDWYFHHNWNHDWDREHDYDYDTDRHYRWREYHEGRGYWRDGVWVSF